MAVELDHPFTTAKSMDENWAAILDLERVVPAVEGGRVIEKTGPNSAKAEIKVKMGAMSRTFTGTVEVTEQDEADHRAVIGLVLLRDLDGAGKGHRHRAHLELDLGLGRVGSGLLDHTATFDRGDDALEVENRRPVLVHRLRGRERMIQLYSHTLPPRSE